jgi:predicted metal-dependent phosphoesterase TrpH
MVRRGYVASVKEAFDRYLRAGGPAYVSHRKLTVRDACALIHRAGGVAVMAHPGFNGGAEALIRELAGEGLLDGVECYYAEHTPEQTAGFVGLCRELGLVTTGGSDFHGPAVRATTLGHPAVPWAAWEQLRRRAGR